MKSAFIKRREWRHKSVRALMQEAVNDDPEAIIRTKAKAIVRGAKAKGWMGPPFKPLQLVSLLGIKFRESRSLFSAEAQLTPVDGNQLLLEFNPDRPLGRKNYSIVHEVAHTFFDDCYEMVHQRTSNRAAFDPQQEVEDLCQLGGANLLMPEEDFLMDLERLPFSLNIVPYLADRYEASNEAVARRMISLADRPAALVFLSNRLKPVELKAVHQDKSEFQPKMRVLYSVRTRDFPVFVPPHKSVSDGSCAYDANLTENYASGIENWGIPGLGTCKVEVMALPVPRLYSPEIPSAIALIQPQI